MSLVPDKALLLFDGDCGICTWCAEWAKAHDRSGEFEVQPYYEFSEEELAPYGLDWAACTRAVQLITQQGRVRSGPFAVNAFLWRQRGWRLLVGLLYILFPLLLIEWAAYALVAKNRHRISAALGMNACRVRYDDENDQDPGPDSAPAKAH